MTAPDGMIAAIVLINGGRLATRNLSDLETTGLELLCPWDFRVTAPELLVNSP